MTQPTLIADTISLPLLPLRDVVVFPHMVIPLFVGRPRSIKALEKAMEAGKHILLVAQKSSTNDDPALEDLFKVGALASILQMLKLPDGTVKVLVEGNQRVNITEFSETDGYYVAHATLVEEADALLDAELEAMRRTLLTQFDGFIKLNKKIPPEILASLSSIEEPGRLADTIAAHLPLKLEQKQAILEMSDLMTRLEHLT
ncbi:MAG: endopeptidase La, partial [Betaproteobacteria bacterium]